MNNRGARHCEEAYDNILQAQRSKMLSYSDAAIQIQISELDCRVMFYHDIFFVRCGITQNFCVYYFYKK